MFSIIHIADLHILDKRHDEYIDVFDVFIDTVRDHISELIKNNYKPIIAILGDIFDRKINTTPKEQDLFYYLITNLLEFQVPVIIIPGNHDCNMNNSDSMDLIEPLARAIQTPLLYYWNRSKVYKLKQPGYDQIRFHLFSPIDKLMPDFGENYAPDTIHIALVHELVRGSTIPSSNIIWDDDTRLDAEKMSFTYNATLMGDIHKYQLLQPNVGYSGSLIQQNIGEHPLDHGYLEWILDNTSSNTNCTTKFHRIKNPLGVMLKIKLSGNKVNELVSKEIDKLQSAVIEYKNTESKVIEHVIKSVESKYNIKIHKIIDVGLYSSDTKEEEKKYDINWNNQSECLKKYLNDQKVNNELVDKVLEKHNIMMKTKTQYAQTGSKWKPIYMEWQNMMCYGNDKLNHINFKELDTTGNLIGVIGKNKAGKSTLWDIFIFILWNEILRGNINDLINKNSKSYYCRMDFMIINDRYTIIRNGDRKRHSEHKIYKNAKNITCETIIKTYQMIETLIGTFHNFSTINYQAQDTKLFTTLGYNEQSKYIMNLLNMNHLSDLLTETKTQIRILKQTKKNLLKPDKSTVEYQKLFTKYNNDLKDLKNTLKSINDDLIELDQSILENTSKIGDYADEFLKIEEYKTEFKNLKSFIKNLNIDESLLDNQVDENIQLKIQKLEYKLSVLDKPDIDQKIVNKYLKSLDKNPDQQVLKKIEDVKLTEKKIIEMRKNIKPLWDKKPEYKAIEIIDKPKKVEPVDQKTIMDENYSIRELQSNIKNLKKDIKNYSKGHFQNNIDFEEEIAEYKECLDYECKIHLDALESQINEFKFDSDCECCKFNKVKLNYKELESKRDALTERLKGHLEAEKRITQLKEQYNHYKYNEIELKLINKEEELLALEKMHKKHVIQSQKYNQYLQDKENYEWNSIYQSNMDLINDIQELQECIDQFNEIKKYINYKKYYDIDGELNNIRSIGDNIIVFNKSHMRIKELKVKIKKIVELKTLYDENISNISEKEISLGKKDKIEKYIFKSNTMLIQTSNDLKHSIYYDKEIEKMDNELLILETYKKALCPKKGFSTILLNNAAKYLSNIINNVLGYVCKDHVDYITEGGVSFTIDNMPIQSTSGFQKMIVNIALRIAFMKFANNGTLSLWQDTLVIDEGLFGACDVDHLYQLMKTFLPNLASQGIKFIIISHQMDIMSHMQFALNLDNRKHRLQYGSLLAFKPFVEKQDKPTIKSCDVYTIIEAIEDITKEITKDVAKEAIEKDSKKIKKVKKVVVKKDKNKIKCNICNKIILASNKEKHQTSNVHKFNLDNYTLID
jgi:hypothetical protein